MSSNRPVRERRNDTRDRIIRATSDFVRERGPTALTIEAAAAAAGVSKGGLLYHFATKEQLTDAVIEAWLEDFEAQVERHAKTVGWLEGYVIACDVAAGSPQDNALNGAISLAMTGDPERMRQIGRRHEEWQRRILAEATTEEEATLVRLAGDGLWIADLTGLTPPRGEERKRAVALMRERARDATRPGS